MDIRNKIAIITGASSGIGKATAELFAQKGAKVALVARSKEKLEELAAQLPGSAVFVCDMTKTFQVKRTVDDVARHFGAIDVLVNNAGQGYDAPVEKTDIDILRYIFELTVVGPVVAMQAAIPIMRKQGGGAILNMSSGTALMHLPNNGAYASMKRAIADMSLMAREELKKDNITIGTIYPYITATEFEKNTIREGDLAKDWEEPSGPQPPDSAEFVAQKILEGIESGAAEIIPHEWMRSMRRQA